MVVWVFSGGGVSEMRALIPFLRNNFSECFFERKTPYRKKPGPKPGQPKTLSSLGRTGKSLADQIKYELAIALKNGFTDMILVMDDLDCNDAKTREKFFFDAIDSIPETADIMKQVGFAAPEIESWLIADWENTFAKDVDFRSKHENMRWWLSNKGISFGNPESFSKLCPERNSCEEKLSELIIESSQRDEGMERFSKGTHTPRLLMNINPDIVCEKCPYFRDFYFQLKEFCNKPQH